MASSSSTVTNGSLSPTKPSRSRSPSKSGGASSISNDVQKRTFTRWINSHIARGENGQTVQANIVQDLFTDLKDGRRVCLLVKVLTGEALRQERGTMRVHHITNLNRALSLLDTSRNIKFTKYNISAEDLADGNPSLTLGFVWRLILHFQVQTASEDSDDSQGQLPAHNSKNAKEDLLQWCKDMTVGYAGVSVDNFQSSWYDGTAFLALVHRHCPERVGEWRLTDDMLPVDKCSKAFEVAEKEFEVYPLLDATDVSNKIVDDLSTITYLAMLRQSLMQATPSPVLSNTSSVMDGDACAEATSSIGQESGTSPWRDEEADPVGAMSIQEDVAVCMAVSSTENTPNGFAALGSDQVDAAPPAAVSSNNDGQASQDQRMAERNHEDNSLSVKVQKPSESQSTNSFPWLWFLLGVPFAAAIGFVAIKYKGRVFLNM